MCLAAQAPSCSVQGLPSLLWPEGSSLLAVACGVFHPCFGLQGLPSLLWCMGSSLLAMACGAFPPCCGLWGLHLQHVASSLSDVGSGSLTKNGTQATLPLEHGAFATGPSGKSR